MLANNLRRVVQAGVPRNGLIAEYLLQDGVNQTVVRNTAPALTSLGNGAKFNNPLPRPARLGNGWWLNNGVSNYGAVDVTKPFPVGDMTITMDVLFTGFGTSYQAYWLLADYSSSGANTSATFAIGTYGSTWYVNVGNGATYWAHFTTPISLSLNTWYRMAIKVVGTSIRMYINGTLHTEWTSSILRGTASIYKASFGIGGEYRGGASASVMSRIRIYNRGLNDNEIMTIANEVALKNTGWNPLKKAASVTLYDNDRIMTSFNADSALGVPGASSGKRMFEITCVDAANVLVGVGTENADLGYYPGGSGVNSWGFYVYNGTVYHNGTNSSYGPACSIGDVIGVVVDFPNNLLRFYRNGVDLGIAAYGMAGKTLYPMAGSGSLYVFPNVFFNTGEFGFAYPISGVDPWN